jgi:peptidoglycan/xylan/chitin deacetylase (PgdA/CDA1 family)
MAEPFIIFLMYHELELPGRATVQSDRGYTRYVLDVSHFRAQMQFLKQQGWRSMTVSEALTFPKKPGVAVTFDDGCETDLLAAAPILQGNGFGATFYVTSGFLGRRGYMSHSQLRELAALGFEIGCHSMTHAYLPDLDEAGLWREIAEAKFDLEQILGRAVEHFSCPGGRYSNRAAEVVRSANYRTLATSRIHTNRKSTNSFALGRIAMLRGIELRSFSDICQGRGLATLRMSYMLRVAAHGVLGNAVYERVRRVLLPRDTQR